jgi:chromosome segregation ATPase
MEEKKKTDMGGALNGSSGSKKDSLFSCICHEGDIENSGAQASQPAMQPPPPPPSPPAPKAPAPPSPSEIAWKKEIMERLSRSEAAERELKAEISALNARLEQVFRAGEAGKRDAQVLEIRLKENIGRLENDLAGSLSSGLKRIESDLSGSLGSGLKGLEERLAAAERALNSLCAATSGPFAAKSDLETLSHELGRLKFELASFAGRADSLARALPELSRIAPKVDLLEGGYSEFLKSLRKIYEIDSRYSYLAGKLEEMENSLGSAAAARGKDQDRFSRLEVKAVELEGRADHLSSLFNYFRDMFEKFIGSRGAGSGTLK